jgi:lipopolysaccharide/colanic/teichoic acid biosynthesis glycosyltransferase
VDELPQLVNILKGDMAFVGPRPERPEFVEELEARIPSYGHRHLVKPGLTGWAQVAFSYAASVDASREKLRYDLYYVKHMSAIFDIVILAATAKAVLRGRGLS